MHAIGSQSYLTELELVSYFSQYLTRKGYDALLEYQIGGMRVNLVAFKKMDVVVCVHKTLLHTHTILSEWLSDGK